MKTITTERLILRPLDYGDVDGLFELDSNPNVHRYLGNNPVTHVDQSTEVVTHVQKQYKEFGIGRFAVELRESGEFLGWSGLKYETMKINNQNGYYDLGYRFIERFWGKGYATESAIASLRFGFEDLKYSKINAAADVNNLGSNTILQKIGMKLQNTFMYRDTKCNWYELNADEYQGN